ncbi:MAG: phosphonate ABC transporter ATP-binding protein, partial [Bdellovibrionales bacterium]|nr:phosphonate ABC transporter ATP-binding protein [Bdellovibrionales bacterium]
MKVQQPILSVKNLSMTFPNGVQALKNVSFDVYPGEFLVVIGLSGSGKSTLLRCINRLLTPTNGHIIFQNNEITTLKGAQVQNIRSKISMIFQHFNLISRHSVLSNVLMGCLSRTATLKSLMGIFAKGDTAKALAALKLVGISEKAHVRAGQLSGGQQQRVAIARALVQEPQVLLADEPVASLDPATCHTIMDHLEKINKDLDITIICNLHFLSLVRRYATRVIALKAGELVYSGTPDNITEEWF